MNKFNRKFNDCYDTDCFEMLEWFGGNPNWVIPPLKKTELLQLEKEVICAIASYIDAPLVENRNKHVILQIQFELCSRYSVTLHRMLLKRKEPDSGFPFIIRKKKNLLYLLN